MQGKYETLIEGCGVCARFCKINAKGSKKNSELYQTGRSVLEQGGSNPGVASSVQSQCPNDPVRARFDLPERDAQHCRRG